MPLRYVWARLVYVRSDGVVIFEVEIKATKPELEAEGRAT